jgi:GNAT superfamily N-acetyltransferase
MARAGREMFEIRRYEERDREPVLCLHKKALERVGARPGDSPRFDDLGYIEEAFLRNYGEFLVGCVDGQVVAMGGLKRISDTHAEIVRMRVMPEFQGRGFGKAILLNLEATARRLGYEELSLQTTTRQLAAQTLYTRFGYRETQRLEDCGFEVIRYRKHLDPEG